MDYKNYLVELDREIGRISQELKAYKTAQIEEFISRLIEWLKGASLSLRDLCINLLHDPAYREVLENPDFIRYIFCQGLDVVSYNLKMCMERIKEGIKSKQLPEEVGGIIDRLNSIRRGLRAVEHGIVR